MKFLLEIGWEVLRLRAQQWAEISTRLPYFGEPEAGILGQAVSFAKACKNKPNPFYWPFQF
jgi:hypothetical protein